MAMISIIMPVYNTGVVIHDTIKSILNQTYTDFELLLIDDGSTDGTGAICDEYAIKDSRIKVFHKKNGGICDARNYGLSKVRSKYLTFCDHDDLYNEKLLERTITVAERYGCDVVKFGYQNIDEQKKKVGPKHDYGIGIQFYNNVNDVYLDFISRGILRTIWNAIYRSDLLLNNKLYFDVAYKHGGEDFSFNLSLIQFVKTMVILSEELYIHVPRLSLSTSSKYYEDVLLNFLCHIKSIHDVSRKLGVNNVNSNIAYFDIYVSRIISYTLYAIKMKKGKDTVLQNLDRFYQKREYRPVNYNWKIYKMYAKNTKPAIKYILFNIYINKMFNLFYALLKIKTM